MTRRWIAAGVRQNLWWLLTAADVSDRICADDGGASDTSHRGDSSCPTDVSNENNGVLVSYGADTDVKVMIYGARGPHALPS